MDAKPRLPDQVRERLRTLHYSYRTEQACLFWIGTSFGSTACATPPRWAARRSNGS
jgi:hypothetical protein